MGWDRVLRGEREREYHLNLKGLNETVSNDHKGHWELCRSQPGTMETPHNSEPIVQDMHKCGYRLLNILVLGIGGT